MNEYSVLYCNKHVLECLIFDLVIMYVFILIIVITVKIVVKCDFRITNTRMDAFESYDFTP